MWYLIVSTPDLYTLTYFHEIHKDRQIICCVAYSKSNNAHPFRGFFGVGGGGGGSCQNKCNTMVHNH